MNFLLTVTNNPPELLLFAFICGYLSGSVPYGLILGKLAGVGDIRKQGSGNIGATNVLRIAGKKVAVIALVLDMLKGYVPVAVAAQVQQDYAVLAGLGAFLGHVLPVWLKFKGGKGVATAFGVCFGLSPALGGIMCGLWLIVAGITQYSSAAALAAFSFSPLLALILNSGSPKSAPVSHAGYTGMNSSLQIALTVLIMAIIIWVRHYANIKRLIKNTESKINFSDKAKAGK